MSDEITASSVLAYVSVVANTILGFFLYLVRDKLMSMREENERVTTQLNAVQREVAVMAATNISSKDLEQALKEWKKEWKSEFDSFLARYNEKTESQEKQLKEVSTQLIRITALLENNYKREE